MEVIEVLFRINLNAANDCITNATARLPIFKHYNIQEDVIHASADGQKFEAHINKTMSYMLFGNSLTTINKSLMLSNTNLPPINRLPTNTKCVLN